MRIIGGEHRGRPLLSPKGMVTRPITDRVKESLFNILFGRLESARVADLFCGTGSLGLESLSRGAAKVFFADKDRNAINQLKTNIETLNVQDKSVILRGDIIARLDTWMAEAGKIDVAFLDPPYPLLGDWINDDAFSDSITVKIFKALKQALAADGIVMMRTPRDVQCPQNVAGLVLDSRREYGSMALNFYVHL